jgi:YbbR domain-containing protein
LDKLLHYLSVLREYAKDYFLENTGLKFLALFITAVLWLSVASRPVSQVTLRDVPIEFRNLSEDPLLTVSESEAMTVRVYLEGPRDVLDTVRAGDVTVSADLRGVEPGSRVKELSVDTSSLPPNVTMTGVEPRKIRFTVERVVVSGDLPVQPLLAGEPPGGFTYTWDTIPKTVRVVGPESQVAKIEKVFTETVSLAGRTESFSKRVAVDIGVPNLNLSDDSSRSVELTVVIGKERVFERVPVAIFPALPNKEPVPRFIKVVVFGEGAAIDSMTADDVSVAIDYQDQPAASTRFTPRVTISPHYAGRVTVRSFEPETLSVR